jgi:hypothetical protein
MRKWLVGMTFAGFVVAVAGGPQGEPRVSYSETLRYESKTVSEQTAFSSSSSTTSVSVGKTILHVEAPMEIGADLPPTTKVIVAMGTFRFEGTLGDDAKYQPGKNQARLMIRFREPGRTVSRVEGSVNLKWDRNRLTVDVETTQAAAAEEFVPHLAGDARGEAPVQVEFAGKSMKVDLPITAKIRRKTAAAGNVEGEVVIVDTKGRL